MACISLYASIVEPGLRYVMFRCLFRLYIIYISGKIVFVSFTILSWAHPVSLPPHPLISPTAALPSPPLPPAPVSSCTTPRPVSRLAALAPPPPVLPTATVSSRRRHAARLLPARPASAPLCGYSPARPPEAAHRRSLRLPSLPSQPPAAVRRPLRLPPAASPEIPPRLCRQP
ncbi:hypothetical protein BS78_02G196400 [Paspalum vaginatum]|nr:hypothetical protein BS78_02G196400 [Paspalum vaginatum]